MLLSILAPRLCPVCGRTLLRAERLMCIGCDMNLPRLRLGDMEFNEIHRRLGHSVKIHRATAWIQYKSGESYSRLILLAKYGGRPSLGCLLGSAFAAEVLPSGFFSGIDAIVPVPIHFTKRLRRGYNQTERIARGISQVTGIPVMDVLRTARAHGVQSRHTRNERFTAIAGTIALRKKARVGGLRLLIVDDIITTGATIAECVRALTAAGHDAPAAISVAAIAMTTSL